MPLFLTSFQRLNQYEHLVDVAVSVSRFQPKGFSLPEISALAAKDETGGKLLLRQFTHNPLHGYRKALYRGYKKRWPAVKQWMLDLDESSMVAIVCWCPYSRATRNQLRLYGTSACHTGLIARMVQNKRPDITILLDRDHFKLVPEWCPENYGLLNKDGSVIKPMFM